MNHFPFDVDVQIQIFNVLFFVSAVPALSRQFAWVVLQVVIDTIIYR